LERIVEVETVSFEETKDETSLRPSIWDEYIGQEKIKKNLKVFIEACKIRGEVLDHILFFLQDLEKLHLAILLQIKWKLVSK